MQRPSDTATHLGLVAFTAGEHGPHDDRRGGAALGCRVMRPPAGAFMLPMAAQPHGDGRAWRPLVRSLG